MTVQASPRIHIRLCSKIPTAKMAGGVVQVVECATPRLQVQTTVLQTTTKISTKRDFFLK
jgi:hypothetical protein